MEPVFFVVRRSARQIRLEAAQAFNAEKGTYQTFPRRHPRVEEIGEYMTIFQMVARKIDPSRLGADKLVEAAEPFFKDLGLTCRLLPATGKLPSRIMLRGAA